MAGEIGQNYSSDGHVRERVDAGGSRERGAVSSLLRYLDGMERAHDLIRFRSAGRGSIVSQFLSKSSKVKKIIQKGKS
jgi:hypothetical protein